MKKHDYCKKCHQTFNTKNALKLHNKSKHRVSTILPRLTIVLVIVFGLYIMFLFGYSLEIPNPNSESPTPYAIGSIHIHATIDIMIGDFLYDLNKEEFYGISPAVHLHPPGAEGANYPSGENVIHIHAQTVSIGYFLETLGIRRDVECLVRDTGEKYCASENSSLDILVNGASDPNNWNYIMKDGDKLIITDRDR